MTAKQHDSVICPRGIKQDAIEEYELEPTRVWAEMPAKLKEVGRSDWSIFRRGQDWFLLFLGNRGDRRSLLVVRQPSNTTMAFQRGLGDRRQKAIVCSTS